MMTKRSWFHHTLQYGLFGKARIIVQEQSEEHDKSLFGWSTVDTWLFNV